MQRAVANRDAANSEGLSGDEVRFRDFFGILPPKESGAVKVLAVAWVAEVLKRTVEVFTTELDDFKANLGQWVADTKHAAVPRVQSMMDLAATDEGHLREKLAHTRSMETLAIQCGLLEVSSDIVPHAEVFDFSSLPEPCPMDA